MQPWQRQLNKYGTGISGLASGLAGTFARGAQQVARNPLTGGIDPNAVLNAVVAPQSLFAGRSAEAAGPPMPPRLSRQFGPPVPPGLTNRLAAPTPSAPITSPNTTFQHADDEYNRLKSQYGGAPGVEQLAMQTSLPTGFTPTGAKGPASLKDFYSAESQVGSRDMESIIGQMGYQGKMAEWAKANPMLAQREYAKKFSADQAAAGYGGTGPSDDAIRAAISGGKFFPSAGSPSPIANPPEFGTPANAVPAPPMDQGRKVSAPYDQAQAQAAEKTAGATGMPNFQTTESPGQAFLKGKLGQALQTSAVGTLMNAAQGFLPNWGN